MYKDGFVFELLTSQDKERLVECVQECFPAPQGETMANVLELTPQRYLKFTEMVCNKAVEDGLTFVAKNAEGGIIGFCIAEDFVSAPRYSGCDLDSRFTALFAILEDLEARYLSDRQIEANEVLHLYMLGVRTEYCRQGVGRELLAGMLHFARENGFSYAVAEATGTASQKILKRMGFEVRAAVPYVSFTLEGKQPFSTLKSPEACLFVEKLLE